MAEKEKNISSIYGNIGKFVVEFEQVCQTMESGIRSILTMEGLKSDRVQEILLADLTAEPLRALFHSLCYEHLKPDAETAKIIDYVFSTFQKLIPDRNNLLHVKWFLIEQELEGRKQAIALGQKLHKKKTGSATKQLKYDIDTFENLVLQARLSLSNMSKLTNCIAGCYPIAKNFMTIKKGEYEPIKGLCIM